MSLFEVDQNKCLGDGKCAAECPMGIIRFNENVKFPAPVPGADELCIDCGHCVAVCPKGALALKTMSPEQCLPMDEEWPLKKDLALQWLKARRSIRSFKNQSVDREIITELIKVARYAPTGRNTQPVHWLVIHEPEEVRRLEELVIDWMRYMIKKQSPVAARLTMDRVVSVWEAGGKTIITFGAPHAIIAHTDKYADAGLEAGIIALTFLELAVPTFDLGACWAGYFNTAAKYWPPMKEALALPEGHEPCGAMMIGYPKFRYHRIPLRKPASITWR